MSTSTRPLPRHVLFCNDDGPPDPSDSPFIVPFVAALSKRIGCHASVAIPASNMSFIGKAMLAREHAHVNFYNVATGAISRKQNNGDWVLVTGTPATCVNIALGHPELLAVASSDTNGSLQQQPPPPPQQQQRTLPPPVDLVVSGPNVGRNTGAAIILTSGTVGAALEASMCGVRAIALSFAYYNGKNFPEDEVSRAVAVGCDIVLELWDHWQAGVDVYNVNIPLTSRTDVLPVCMTTAARSYYGCIYSPAFKLGQGNGGEESTRVERVFGGDNSTVSPGSDGAAYEPEDTTEQQISFRHAMRMHTTNPAATAFGTDAWAVSTGAIVSVTPLLSHLAEPPVSPGCVCGGVVASARSSGQSDALVNRLFPYSSPPEALRDLPPYKR